MAAEHDLVHGAEYDTALVHSVLPGTLIVGSKLAEEICAVTPLSFRGLALSTRMTARPATPPPRPAIRSARSAAIPPPRVPKPTRPAPAGPAPPADAPAPAVRTAPGAHRCPGGKLPMSSGSRW